MKREASGHRKRARHRADEMEYAIIYALAYPFFLFGAVLHRLMPVRSKVSIIDGRPKSVFETAAETAHSVLPWMFMGR